MKVIANTVSSCHEEALQGFFIGSEPLFIRCNIFDKFGQKQNESRQKNTPNKKKMTLNKKIITPDII